MSNSDFNITQFVQLSHMIPLPFTNQPIWETISSASKQELLAKHPLTTIQKVLTNISANHQLFFKIVLDYEKSDAKNSFMRSKIAESLVTKFNAPPKQISPTPTKTKKEEPEANKPSAKDILREKERKAERAYDDIEPAEFHKKEINIEYVPFPFIKPQIVDLTAYSAKKSNISSLIIQNRYKNIDLNKLGMISMNVSTKFSLIDTAVYQDDTSSFSKCLKNIISKQLSDCTLKEVMCERMHMELVLEEYKKSLESLCKKYNKTENEIEKYYMETCGNLKEIEKICRGSDANRWHYLEDLVLTEKEESRYSILLKTKGESEIRKRRIFLGIK